MNSGMSEVLVQIQDEEGFAGALEQSKTMEVVFDVHKGWCGPCEAMWPTFQSIRSSTPLVDKRMAVYSVRMISTSNIFGFFFNLVRRAVAKQ